MLGERTRRVMTAAAVLAAAIATLVILPSSPASAVVPSTPSPTVGSVNETADYASTAWSDAWDYSNGADFNTTPGAASSGISNITMNQNGNGLLSFDTSAGGYFYAVNDWGLVIPHDHDGPIKPINAGAFPRISFRMYSSQASSAGVYWWPQGCAAGQACFGAMSFGVSAGWNTYNLTITPNLVNVAWSGLIHELRIVPNGNAGSTHVDVDWLRVNGPAAGSTSVNVGSTGADQLWWTTSGSTTPSATATTGLVASNVPQNGSAAFPSDAYPPGAYRFFTVKTGQVSALSSALTISAKPEPVVISPSLTTGDDWATVVRGNPWDMASGSGDLTGSLNVNMSSASNWVCGTGTGTVNDPQLYLAVPTPIDASLYHRLTFLAYYDPPFSLANAPGGGMVARVAWVANDPVLGMNARTSQDIVVYPGWQTISIDLKTNPLSTIEEEGSPDPIGWGGPRSGQVLSLRFDPDEDPGGKQFCLDDMKLTRNDRGNPNYTIRFLDKVWKAGEVADIYVSPNADGSSATQIASGVAVVQNENQFVWSNSAITTNSSWYVKVVIRDSAAASGTMVSNGQVDMAPPPVNPFGAFDHANATAGGVNVDGWALDPQQGVNSPISVQASVDGVTGPTAVAGLVRDDVAAAYPGHGNQLGFNFKVPAPPGAHTVCLTALNVGAGSNTSIGSRTVTVLSGDPFGAYDQARVVGPDQVVVSGWMIDPDTTAPTDVHVYVDGVGTRLSANQPRGDIASIFPGYAASGHGFSQTLTVGGGTHNVCAYGINMAGPGANVFSGCRSVDVPYQPFGSFDALSQVGANLINVSGWAIDPDTASATDVHVYIDGVGNIVKADKTRNDLLFFGYGAGHGFNNTFAIPGGTHNVCAYAINTVGPGSHVSLGCRSISMPYQPFGNLESVSRSGSNVVVSGWAIDPDNPNPTDVHVYVDGVGSITTAGLARADIAAAFPLNGPNHGFSKSIAVPLTGASHTVCAYVINTAGPGSNALLGCVAVT